MNTVSLDLAKRLHASGYRGETSHWWEVPKKGKIVREPWISSSSYSFEGSAEKYPAPNATELLRDMPDTFSLYKDKLYQAEYGDEKFIADTPPNALAKLLIHLYEKGIIK